jgi:hypothetical protein
LEHHPFPIPEANEITTVVLACGPVVLDALIALSADEPKGEALEIERGEIGKGQRMGRAGHGRARGRHSGRKDST